MYHHRVIGCRHIFFVPYALVDLRDRHNASAMVRQELQNRKLCLRQLQRLAAAQNAPVFLVEPDVAFELLACDLALVDAVAADELVDLHQKLPVRKRLCQIVVAAGLICLELILLLRSCCEEQNRRAADAADLFTCLDAG